MGLQLGTDRHHSYYPSLLLDGHYLRLFGLGRGFNGLFGFGHSLFDLRGESLGVVFADVFVFFSFVNNVDGVVADLAKLDHGVFLLLANLLGEIAAALLVERRHRNSDNAPVVGWVQAETSIVADSQRNRLNICGIKWTDLQQLRLWC